MEMIKSYPAEISKKDKYRLMKSRAVQKMSSMDGNFIKPRAWILFNDEDFSTGEIRKVFVVQDDATGEMYGTISPTFIQDFEDIITIFGDNIDDGGFTPLLMEGKSGRSYLVCEVS